MQGQSKDWDHKASPGAATSPTAHLHKSLGMLGDASGTEPARVSTGGLSSPTSAPRWQQNEAMKSQRR